MNAKVILHIKFKILNIFFISAAGEECPTARRIIASYFDAIIMEKMELELYGPIVGKCAKKTTLSS